MTARRLSLIIMLFVAILFGGFFATYALAAGGGTASPKTVEITITAEQFRFLPERIFVTQGDHVVIRIHTSDSAHGFYLDGYGINREIMPGEEVVIEFTATNVGKFAFRCSFTCGTYHPYMKGELVVEGPSGNLPFFGTLLLTVGVAAGSILYVHRRGN